MENDTLVKDKQAINWTTNFFWMAKTIFLNITFMDM